MKLKEKLLQYNLVNDNEYVDKYVELIEKNIDNKSQKFLTHRHHIIPKYYFKYNNLDCDNTKDNIVNLKYSDHILAHFYLFKCSTELYYKFCNSEAILRLIGTIPENEIDIIKKSIDLDYVEYQRRLLFSEQLKGHFTSEQVKHKISQSNKLTKAHNKYKYIHKDDIETCVPEYLLNDYLSDGWELGFKRKMTAWNKGAKTKEETRLLQSKAKLGKVHIYKDNNDKLVDESLLDNYLSNGWELGRCQSTADAISKGSLGKAGTFKDKHHTADAKEAIGKANSGGKYINKNGEVKHVKLEDLDAYLNDGWKIGNCNNTKGSFKWMTNGMTALQVKTKDIDKFLKEGYSFGRVIK